MFPIRERLINLPGRNNISSAELFYSLFLLKTILLKTQSDKMSICNFMGSSLMTFSYTAEVYGRQLIDQGDACIIGISLQPAHILINS